ncbi:MAG: hypothetical protein Q4F72_08580 [Desulfovibrionaceae bacterium]|nr:hypothetical protein [Desulfovibrionaceae bacterium]
MQTRGSITRLLARYRAVLANCRRINRLALLPACIIASLLAGALPAVSAAQDRVTVRTGETAAYTATEFRGLTSGTAQEGFDTLDVVYGAAVWNEGALTLSGCTFADNGKDHTGGAIASLGELVISDSDFTGNSGDTGGVLYSGGDRASLAISGSSFTGNRAEFNGGAIESDGPASISDSAFVGNTAGSYGGAIETSGTMTISGSSFTDNAAGIGGGAIENAGTLTIADSTFSGNTAGLSGGVLHNWYGTVTIGGETVFTGNSATGTESVTGRGGAISNVDGTLTIAEGASVLFSGNTAEDETSGAIYNEGTMLVQGAVTLGTASDTIANGGTLTFAKASTLTIDVAEYSAYSQDAESVAAITNSVTSSRGYTISGKLVIEDGAALALANAKAGTSYLLVSDSSDEPTVWTSFAATTPMLSLALSAESGVGVVAEVGSAADAAEVFPSLSSEGARLVNGLYGQALNDTEAEAQGVRLLSRASDTRYLASDRRAAAASLESASRVLALAGVPQMTRTAAEAASRAASGRMGLADLAGRDAGVMAVSMDDEASGLAGGDAAANGDATTRSGAALWIAPLWQNHNGHGYEAGSLDYGFAGSLGGIALGMDWTSASQVRVGVQMHMGGGWAESSGDLASTRNNMTFWGAGLYGGWRHENIGLMAEAGWTGTASSVKQDLDSRLGMGDELEADIRAEALTAGLRAEYTFATPALDLTPHAAVRVMSLTTYGYDVDSASGTVLESDGSQQTIWTFPVGVTFSKDVALANGWTVRPSLDVTFIPAAGDLKSREDVRYTGLPASVEMESDIMDYNTWQGTAGVEFGGEHLKLGVNYTLQAGAHTTSHGLNGTLRWEF